MRFGIFSAVAAVAFTVPDLVVLVRGVHISRDPSKSPVNFAQMTAMSKTKIEGIDSQIKDIRNKMHKAEKERNDLQKVREDYENGKDTYNDILMTV